MRRLALGGAIGVIFGFQCWRIAMYGFSIPFGLRPAVFGLVAVGAGLIAGLLIALFVNRPAHETPRLDSPVPVPVLHVRTPESSALGMIRRRLATRKARLDRLDAERKSRAGNGAACIIGDRIIWGELLELELQDLDEQVSRLSRQLAKAASESQSQPAERRTPCNRQLTSV